MHYDKQIIAGRDVFKSIGAGILALAYPSITWAQPSDTQQTSDGLGEIVVTAQKRSQIGQDVPIALSVVSGASLAERNVSQISDLTGLVPNIQANYGFGPVTYNMRGIGTNDFSTNFDSPIAVNVDEGYLSKNYMNGLLLFDIDRVEVLKGPQGTTFGRNATGGAVNFYTRNPTDIFSAGANLSYDNYRTIRTEAYLSGPLGGGFSARIAGQWVDQDKGYYRNLVLGGTEGKEKKWAVRGKLKWTNGHTTALLTINAGHQGGTLAPYTGAGIYTPESVAAGAPVFCAAYVAGHADPGDPNCVRGFDGLYPGDRNPYTSTNNRRHAIDTHSVGASLRIDHDLGWGTLTSLSTYNRFRRVQNEDSSGSPGDDINIAWDNEIRQFTEEVRLASNGAGPWNYVAGAFYEHDSYRNGDYLQLFNATAGIYSPFRQKTDALAIFFNSDVELTRTLSLTAGLRYSNERIGFNGGTYSATGAQGTPATPTTITGVNSFARKHERNDGATFKVGLQYKPSLNISWVDRLMLYANVSTGFRSGAFNGEFNGSQAELTALSPEKITAYEAGIKSNLFRNRAQLNIALFRYDFTDGFINVDNANSPIPLTTNAGAIKSWGGEIELQMRPITPLTVQLAASYLSSHIAEDLSVNGVNINGVRTVQSPKFTFNAQANWVQPISDDYEVSLAADANWRSSQFFETTGDPNSLQRAYWIVNGNVNFGPKSGAWSIGGFVKNLTKSVYTTYSNNVPGLGFDLFLYGNPRTYGLQASVKF